MPRKAWFRDFDGWWYCQVGDVQFKLAKGKRNRAEANRRLREIQLKHPKPVPTHLRKVTVSQLRDAFLVHSAAAHDPETTDWFRRFLGQFCERFGHLRPQRIAEEHLTGWLHEEKNVPVWNRDREKKRILRYRKLKWASSTKNAAARCVTQLFNWAIKKTFIAENPLQNFRKPPMKKRQRLLTADERTAILAAVREREFKMYLFALGNTGARPGEIRKVTAAHFRLPGMWAFEDDHKTADATGEPRTVFLTPPMVKLCGRLARMNPHGPLFRMPDGRPWNRQAVRMRLRSIRRKLKLEPGVCAYAYRHSWITQGLANGVDIHTMAILAGHRSTRMIESHYSKLSKLGDYMRHAAIAATGTRRIPPRDNRRGTSEDPRPEF